MKKNMKVVAVGCIALALVVAIFGGIFLYNMTLPTEGSKSLGISVVHGDESTKNFTLNTDAQYLSEALLEEKLVEGSEGEYGLFITVVDGEAADESKQQWWCITKGGEDVFTGASETVIADGEAYELTLKTGY